MEEVDLIPKNSDGVGTSSRGGGGGGGGAPGRGSKVGGKASKKKGQVERVLSSQARNWMREHDYDLDEGFGDIDNEVPQDCEGGERMDDGGDDDDGVDCGIDAEVELEIERWLRMSRWPAFQCVPSPYFQFGHSRRSALMVDCMLGKCSLVPISTNSAWKFFANASFSL